MQSFYESSPNFKSHPCSDYDSVPTEPELILRDFNRNKCRHLSISFQRRRCWDFSCGCFPTRTVVTVFKLVPIYLKPYCWAIKLRPSPVLI